ncbi:hypothetical protein ACTJJ2_19045 [Pseudomonas sp. 22447]|uniref:hypothetical protein n=1 Tax=Pseudomonas sp. 22447 TaxID=3453919 RepID=UPI003F87AD25
MKDVSLLVSLLTRINDNQLALAAGVEELAVWVERRGSTDVASNVRGALETLELNDGFITLALVALKVEGEK